MRKRLVQPGGHHGRASSQAVSIRLSTTPIRRIRSPAGIGVGIHIVVVDVGSDVREELIADLVRCAVENDDVHRHVVLCEEFADGVHCHPGA